MSSSSSIHLPPSTAPPPAKKMRGEEEESPLRRLWERDGGYEDIWRAHVATKLNDSDLKFFFGASR
jgi:hypothetical protein